MSDDKNLTNEEKKQFKKEAKEILEKEQENLKKDNNSLNIPEDFEKGEKIKKYFDKIEFLSLSDEQKEDVSINISKNSKIDKLYIIEVIISSLIVTLGMLQNSVAVVVGAMLIAPILRPLNGLSYGVARGGNSIFKNSFFMLLTSIFITIFLSYLMTFIVGFNNETQEIISRTHPNIIDFFIAVFSGMIGVMSIRFSRLGKGLSGVAMAVALLPPLSVVGIEFAFGNYFSAFGAFLLFLTNTLAIGLTSTIFFWLYGFTPHDKRLQGKVLIRLLIVLFSLILVLVPLFISFDTIKIGNKVSYILENNLKNDLSEDIEITNINIFALKNNQLYIKVVIKIPYGLSIKEVLEKQKKSLEKTLGKKIIIEFQITRFLKL